MAPRYTPQATKAPTNPESPMTTESDYDALDAAEDAHVETMTTESDYDALDAAEDAHVETMTTEPDYAALDAAEDAHVETMTGEQVRAALRPFLDHLRDVYPDGAAGLLTGSGATGSDWIATFRAPTRFGWRGKRYPQPVHGQIVALIDQLDGLQTKETL